MKTQEPEVKTYSIPLYTNTPEPLIIEKNKYDARLSRELVCGFNAVNEPHS